ncbi:rhodanese-like domain-containing protein [Luteipulveratus mongoliensis]|uniref:Rhodanese domain-containing protein n=1 Tax=Luteipulveratus mongoliensis TaxID=571913 RepID=A0A0K1JEU1_9MICO|nr:rhodanese-like domain-containing protein [Luteipulveratus mongoliensis]AKU15209.1 hypothetical protein VV02_03910 [Luteipulveratus mongoliensis]
MSGTTIAHVRWETSLFAGGLEGCPEPTPAVGPGWVSPRAAYQDALYGRATLVDVRPHRARSTVVHPGLEPRDVTDLDQHSGPVILVGGAGGEAATVAVALLRRGMPRVSVLSGGFAGWLAEGLPTQARV